VLLFIVLHLISLFQDPIFAIALPPFMAASVSGHSLIVLAGGVFLMYTAIKEIFHMISMEEHADEAASRAMRSTLLALVWIVAMNVVFSFDTVLSAVALTKNFVVMTTAIILSGALMVLMADTVAEFLNRNRMYEVLGLFVLLLVGIMLTSEGGHIAELAFFGYHVEVMPKTTFYFVLAMLVLVEIVQGRYQRKLLKKKQANAREREATANA
jgi:predicted tellurium resistance membrane protein TerC